MAKKDPAHLDQDLDRDLDRDLAVQLVEQTGRANLVFTVRDVRAEMQATPRLRLTDPSSLSRNVRRLMGGLIEEVGQGELLSDSEGSRKAPYRYVLRSRRDELARGELRMTDSEKVVAAVHVAARLWPEWVHTAAVTEVLRGVPDLALESPAQTSTCLNNLVRAPSPLIEKRNTPGSRWAEWRPSPSVEVGLPLDEWVEEYRDRSEDTAPKPFEVGLPTVTRLCEDLVRAAVTACRRQWSGGGRPVMAKDIERIARGTPDGREALEIIRRRGQSLSGALGNATRMDIPGVARRKTVRIVRIDGPDGRTYYDVPDGQSDLRALYIDYKWCTRQASRHTLREMEAEARRIRPYLSSSFPRVQVIGAARHLLLLRRLTDMRAGLKRVLSRRSHLRAQARNSLEAALARVAETVPVLNHGIAESEAVRLVESAGFDPGRITDRDRPLITAYECVQWLAESQVRGRSAPEYMAMTRLRAFPNPEFARKSIDDLNARTVLAYDRVDALAYLSKHVRSRMTQFVARAATLLGPDLRCPELLLPLAQSSGDELRVGLAGLALLGDERVGARAREILEDPQVSVEEVEAAVWTLMLLRALRVEDLPRHLRRPERRLVFNFVREAVRAADLGRWLY